MHSIQHLVSLVPPPPLPVPPDRCRNPVTRNSGARPGSSIRTAPSGGDTEMRSLYGIERCVCVCVARPPTQRIPASFPAAQNAEQLHRSRRFLLLTHLNVPSSRRGRPRPAPSRRRMTSLVPPSLRASELGQSGLRGGTLTLAGVHTWPSGASVSTFIAHTDTP